MNLRQMKSLIVESSEEVLTAMVAQIADAKSDSELPYIRLTVGAHKFAGIPVKMGSRQTEKWIILVDGDAVSYLPMSAITTVTIDNFKSAPLSEALSKLNIDRLAKEVEGAAAKKGWKGKISVRWGADSEDDRRTAGEALRAMQAALDSILTDSAALDAMAEIKQIQIIPANNQELSVRRDASGISFTVGMAAKFKDGQFTDLLEKNL